MCVYACACVRVCERAVLCRAVPCAHMLAHMHAYACACIQSAAIKQIDSWWSSAGARVSCENMSVLAVGWMARHECVGRWVNGPP